MLICKTGRKEDEVGGHALSSGGKDRRALTLHSLTYQAPQPELKVKANHPYSLNVDPPPKTQIEGL